jgi:LytR cell envelope-related transcriptional attenuator
MSIALACMAAGAMVLGACGGDDDDETAEDTTTDSSATLPPSTSSTLATTPTATLPIETTPSTPVTPTYVTEGAAVLVANASRVDGAAGRMSDRLAAVGFSMVTPGNSTEGPLEVTKIYFDPAVPASQAVAESIKAAFGGGAIEVLPMTVPPPIDTGDLAGANVLVAMGNDTADKTLDELQGITTTTTAPATDTAAESSAPSSTTA